MVIYRELKVDKGLTTAKNERVDTLYVINIKSIK